MDTMLFMDWRDDHTQNIPDMKAANEKLPTFLYAMPFTKNKVRQGGGLLKLVVKVGLCRAADKPSWRTGCAWDTEDGKTRVVVCQVRWGSGVCLGQLTIFLENKVRLGHAGQQFCGWLSVVIVGVCVHRAATSLQNARCVWDAEDSSTQAGVCWATALPVER